MSVLKSLSGDLTTMSQLVKANSKKRFEILLASINEKLTHPSVSINTALHGQDELTFLNTFSDNLDTLRKRNSVKRLNQLCDLLPALIEQLNKRTPVKSKKTATPDEFAHLVFLNNSTDSASTYLKKKDFSREETQFHLIELSRSSDTDDTRIQEYKNTWEEHSTAQIGWIDSEIKKHLSGKRTVPLIEEQLRAISCEDLKKSITPSISNLRDIWTSSRYSYTPIKNTPRRNSQNYTERTHTTIDLIIQQLCNHIKKDTTGKADKKRLIRILSLTLEAKKESHHIDINRNKNLKKLQQKLMDYHAPYKQTKEKAQDIILQLKSIDESQKCASLMLGQLKEKSIIKTRPIIDESANTLLQTAPLYVDADSTLYYLKTSYNCIKKIQTAEHYGTFNPTSVSNHHILNRAIAETAKNIYTLLSAMISGLYVFTPEEAEKIIQQVQTIKKTAEQSVLTHKLHLAIDDMMRLFANEINDATKELSNLTTRIESSLSHLIQETEDYIDSLQKRSQPILPSKIKGPTLFIARGNTAARLKLSQYHQQMCTAKNEFTQHRESIGNQSNSTTLQSTEDKIHFLCKHNYLIKKTIKAQKKALDPSDHSANTNKLALKEYADSFINSARNAFTMLIKQITQWVGRTTSPYRPLKTSKQALFTIANKLRNTPWDSKTRHIRCGG